MNPSLLWKLGAGVAVLAICGGAVVLGVQPSLARAAAADASTAQLQQANASSQVELGRLSALAAKQSTLQAQNARLAAAVSGSLLLSTFSKQVRDTAAADGVSITSLAVATANDYVPPVVPATSSSTTSTPSPAPTAAPAAPPAAATGVFGKTDPLITGSDFAVIPITVTVTGTESSSVTFAQDLQQMARMFAVDTVTYARGSGAGTPPTTTISGNIYALKS
ncbi:hypothetical protein [Amnibacterium sp.]|uniref:hypothetical protein n=1 Tax=Amnibacterium sp. TaxID=1872496 RepID=UPI003F7B88C6